MMRAPSKLRYVECELPDHVEKSIADFEDDFDARFKPFYDRLKDFADNDVPVLTALLDQQIEIREQLVAGSPVQSLGSLEAIDESTGLTNPKRDDEDPETVRIDERKLGAAGICMLGGKLYKILTIGDRLTAYRQLWEISGGNYDLFVTYGMNIFSSPEGTFTLYEYNKSTPDYLPFVNAGFSELEALGYKNSQFRHRMFWNKEINASYAMKTRMASLGYESEQVNDTFSGKMVNASYDFLGTIGTINMLIQALTRLIFLPKTDKLRQPAWDNEANYVIMSIETYLEYRTKKYTTSSTFDPDLWPTLLQELTPVDLKELFEFRPEILNIELPQNQESITALIESALSSPSESTQINTYMVNLPSGDKEENNLSDSLYDFGLTIWKHLEPKSPKANQIEALLLELDGQPGPLDLVNSKLKNPSVLIDPADLSALFPNANLPPQGILVDSVVRAGVTSETASGSVAGGGAAGVTGGSGGSNDASTATSLVNSSLAANSATKKFNKTETKTKQKESEEAGDSQYPSGEVQGFASVETPAMILTRRIKWSDNFKDCSGTVTSSKVSEVVETKKVLINEGKLSPEWQQYKVNNEYVTGKLHLKTDTIAEMRNSLKNHLKTPAAMGGGLGLIAPNDAFLISALSKINSSSDVKEVCKETASVLRTVDRKVSASTMKGISTNEKQKFTGTNAAAKNRRHLADQGGKKASPGLTASETAKLKSAMEKMLDSKLPYVAAAVAPDPLTAAIVGGSVKATQAIVKQLSRQLDTQHGTPFKASAKVERTICTPKAIQMLGAYLAKYIDKLEAWLIRLINILKHQIIVFQDRIDGFILAVQGVMDAILAKLERLLSLDLNFTGKIGFENSLFKCSWGIDLGLKINLLDYLLSLLDFVMPTFMAGFTKGMQIIMDALTELFCIPIRWLDSMLGARSELLAQIGCTVKDFKLPIELLELLRLMQGTFSLRSLVLRKGSADWLSALGRFNLGQNEWSGLTQFAAICSNPNLKAALSAVQSAMSFQSSDLPVAAKSTTSPNTVLAAATGSTA